MAVAITADLVKQLRDKTGAGMMECKKALVETNGDLDAAAELMRKAGLAKADKKATRVAAEGVVVLERSPDLKRAAIVEVNCETDFVARESDFQQYAAAVAKAALAGKAESVEALLALPAPSGGSFEEARRGLIAKIGENITVRRVGQIEAAGVVGSYLHGSGIGALVALKSGDEALARDIAMHVAASNPVRVSANEVPAPEVEKERSILMEQAKGEGKPEAIVAKMVEGRLRKWLNEITLLGQPFVKDPDQSVEKYLKASGGEVSSFLRFEVGAGIEKKQEDFAAEVMKQVRGS